MTALQKYIDRYKHEAIQKPISENNIRAPLVPQQASSKDIYVYCVWPLLETGKGCIYTLKTYDEQMNMHQAPQPQPT